LKISFSEVSLDEVSSAPSMPTAAATPMSEPVTAEAIAEDGEDDTLSYFARMAAED